MFIGSPIWSRDRAHFKKEDAGKVVSYIVAFSTFEFPSHIR